MTGESFGDDGVRKDVQKPTAVDRLPFVDGVRGVAAIVVMMGHLAFTAPRMKRPPASSAGVGDWLLWPFRFGNEMVLLFLMVSGFSLYHSEISRRARGHSATTIRNFLMRRAWRIGPVYYVAVCFGIIVVLAVRSTLVLQEGQPAAIPLTANGVAAHVFFVQNLRPEWLYQVNGPLWSIAYEVQLYLLFPLLFWMMYRRNPWPGAILTVVVLNAVSRFHLGFPIFGLARWFVAGALIAALWRRGVQPPVRITLPIGVLGLLIGMSQRPQLSSELRHDTVWLIAYVGLMFAALSSPAERKNPMNWPWLRWIGLRSYSLYALHYPLLFILLTIAQKSGWRGWVAALFCIGVGVPLSIGLAAVSFTLVEAPSLRRVSLVGKRAMAGHTSPMRTRIAPGQGTLLRLRSPTSEPASPPDTMLQ